ncbi:MAG: cobalamin biosynthesis protein [Candidatus Rokuibacteriota bacterium]
MSEPRRATVTEGPMVAPGVRRLGLAMREGDRLGHRAGQYILVHAPGPDGSPVKRAYSIASPPGDGRSFELCVRHVPGGPASEFVHQVLPGTEVSFTGPWGKFVVDDEGRDLMLVATGSAISCTGAILEDELARPRSRRVRLYWGLRHESDVHATGRLEALRHAHPRFTYRVTLSQPGPGWAGPRGRVTELLRAEAQPDALYYLAGNGAMIADAEAVLGEAGVPATAIRKEAFFTPGQVRVPLRERQARAANRTRPGRMVVGVALHAGVPTAEVMEAITAALNVARLGPAAVRNLAAAAKAADETGLAEAAAALGLPVEFYLPAELEAGGLPPSACEALACVSAGRVALLLPKYRTPAVTVAIAPVSGTDGP